MTGFRGNGRILGLKNVFRVLFLLAFGPFASEASDDQVISSVRELDQALDQDLKGRDFSITGHILLPDYPTTYFYLQDDTGTISMMRRTGNAPPLMPGDNVVAVGQTQSNTSSDILAVCTNITVISHGPAPEPIRLDGRTSGNGRALGQIVRAVGTVRDIFPDELTPFWYQMLLQCGNEIVHTTFIMTNRTEALDGLIGTDVELHGIFMPSRHTVRRQMGPTIYAHGLESIVRCQGNRPDAFAAPALEDLSGLSPSAIIGLGPRRTCGRVIAVWGRRHLILRLPNGGVMRVDLLGFILPESGETIEVVGFPETDLYRINLTRASWRKSDIRIPPEAPPETVSPKRLLTDHEGRTYVNTDYHGRAVRLRGIVRSIPLRDDPNGRLQLETEGFLLPVDVSACPEALDSLEPGCEVEASGVCVNDLQNWNAVSVFPRIKEVFLVLRSAPDLRIVRRPPWWTPARSLTTIGLLGGLLVAFLVWNRSLRRLSERRGIELSDERVARAETDIKVFERTRLAVELHDSLAQNLTGVAMELQAAGRYRTGPIPELLRHLDTAETTLRSCREELRNCLWDLRSQAFEEKDMETAIRRTLLPHTKDVRLDIRFNIPRERFTDHTAHMILRVIRELTINAIRHGGANAVKIACAIEGDLFRCSVRDNGRGFDPSAAPGVSEGHFGLEGIRERILPFEGRLEIRSAPGRGTRASISFRVPFPS